MNAQPTKRTAVPVDLLRPGVYVAELDRPWIETPFVFQGFRIEGETDLAMLRAHCRFVYADLERSQKDAVQAMREEAAQRRRARQAAARERPDAPAQAAEPAVEQRTGPPSAPPRSENAPQRPPSRAVERSLGALIQPVPQPDPQRFSTLIQQARALRHDCLTAMDGTLDQASRERRIDPHAARAAAEEMADTIVKDTTAALWLTRLRDRDEYLATHSVNVCVLSLAVGAHLGLNHGTLMQLGFGALLHAVGRASIPREILDKPGPLSQAEIDRVRRYPEEGYAMVAESGGVPRAARQIIRQHHERWAGHGYPDGLFGESIPRLALITGIADAYDAMVSDRPYRAAMSPEQALNVIYENAGREFGEDVSRAFMRVIGAFPVGSLVELDNGAIGMVVGLEPGKGLWPTVLMLRTPDGAPYDKRLLVNLAVSERAPGDLRNRRIRRARAPGELGIDSDAVVAGEFGLASAA